MIEVNTINKSVQYNDPDDLIDNIQNDFGKDYEDTEILSLMIGDHDYKDIFQLPTVGEVWYWYYGHKKFG